MGENSKGKSVSDLNWELEKLRESSTNALNMSWAEVERLEKEKTMYKERAQKLKEKINYYSQFDFQNDRSQHSQSTKDDMEDSSTVIAKGSLAQDDSEPNSFQGWGKSDSTVKTCIYAYFYSLFELLFTRTQQFELEKALPTI